jgi:uncharacterized membrane protein
LSDPPRRPGRARLLAAGLRLGWPARLALAALLGLGLASGREVFLRLSPALVCGALGLAFQSSLARSEPLVEQLVRRRIPEAPEFIRGYCRGLTRLWAWLLLASALALAALALLGPREAWRAASAWGVPSLLAACAGGEFLFRKWWFRYYFAGGPLDRLLARLFPAEATARGRRSQDYIRRYREVVGSMRGP